jgi:hypothetical protein
MQTIKPLLGGLSLLLLLTNCAQYSKVSKRSIASTAATAEQRALIRLGRSSKRTPAGSIGRYLDAANAARLQIAADPASASRAQADYNFAVARIVGVIADNRLSPWESPVVSDSATDGEWHLSLAQIDPRPEYQLSNIDFYPADRYQFKGTLIGERTLKPGLGAPVILKSREGNS